MGAPRKNKKVRLTKKERGFVRDYLATGNGTKAALQNYDTTSQNVASNIASVNLTKPRILNAIAEALPDDLLAERHLELLNKRDVMGEVEVVAVSKGLDMAYKIKGTYAPEKQAVVHAFTLLDEEKKAIDDILNDNE